MNKILHFLVLAILFSGCKKETDEEFDRGAMLDNMASAVIIPSYETMHSSLTGLNAAATDFTSFPDVTTLATMRSKFMDAYKQFQHCKMYDFGPAMDFGIKAAMNTYPTDTAKIESNIASGSYTLGSAGNVDAIGLPAIDYLLYYGSDAEILDRFTTDVYADNRKTYLTDMTEKMLTEFQYVLGEWNDSYKSEFVAADGTDVGSSTSLMFNEFVKDIELLKNAKVGIPGGQFSGGEPLPETVEALYSGQSKTLALESVSGLLNCFKGGSGSGFDDYIADVEGEEADPSLTTNIQTQFTVIDGEISSLGAVFSDDVSTNYDGFASAFQEIKKLVTYTKTDMASLLGLLITYSDSDGD